MRLRLHFGSPMNTKKIGGCEVGCCSLQLVLDIRHTIFQGRASYSDRLASLILC